MTKQSHSAVFLAVHALVLLHSCSSVTIENNRYTDIVVAIESSVAEDDGLIENLKAAFTEASRSLFIATENRAAFGEITILVPLSWNKTTYNASEGECCGQADFRIAPPNPIFEDLPYTLHVSGCGNQGEYIHITPQYLTNNSLLSNTGPRGKTIVHEWAHYRWGVFDETSTDTPYYLSPNFTGTLTPTGCPEALVEHSGTFYNPVTGRNCELAPDTLLYEKECVYLPSNSTSPEVNTSIMSHHFLDQVVTFCRDGPESGENQHNIYAPNKHNSLCDLRSTWSVIMDSPDFAGGNNPSNDSILDTTPVFRVVQEAKLSRFVLVLDVSGSMGTENRMQEMREAANYFIHTAVPDGAEVGLVSFSSSASTLNEMQLIISDQDRTNLISKLPNFPGGGTSIGSGILRGIQVLRNQAALSASGGNIFVFTDGEETVSPYIKDIYDEVIKEKVIISTVLLVTKLNDILVNLTEETCGSWFTAEDDNEEKLIRAFNAVSNNQKCENIDKNYQIHATTVLVNATISHSSSVFIDKTIGRQTVFAFISFATSALQIVLTGPNCSYANFENHSLTLCEDNPIHSNFAGLATTWFSIPGIAEPGQWFYTIQSKSSGDSSVTVVASSKAANNGLDPINVQTSIIVGGAGLIAPTIIRSQVSQGYFPIQNAFVMATIDRTGVDSVEIQLLDDGAGCDIQANDGVYSSYFTQFNTQGRYTVEVQASGGAEIGINSTTNSASYSNGVVADDGTIVLNPNGPRATSAGTSGESLGRFSRVAAVGGFVYTGRTSTTVDLFPPNQVTDLAAGQANLSNYQDGLRVTFTAPGDDYDFGTASRYELKYTFGDPLLLKSDFESHAEVAETELIEGSLENPQTSGSAEVLVIQPLSLPENESSTQIAFAMRAFDEAGNSSITSNVALAVLFPIPPQARLSASDATTPEILISSEADVTVETTQPTPVSQSPHSNANELYVILMGIFAACTLILLILATYLYVSLRKANRDKKYKADGGNSIENPYSVPEYMNLSLRARQPEFNN